MRRGKGLIAIMQISILVTAMFAFSFILNASFVSAQEPWNSDIIPWSPPSVLNHPATKEFVFDPAIESIRYGTSPADIIQLPGIPEPFVEGKLGILEVPKKGLFAGIKEAWADLMVKEIAGEQVRSILGAAGWALTAYGIGKMIISMAGWEGEEKLIAEAVNVGASVGLGIGLLKKVSWKGGLGWGLFAGLIYYLISDEKETKTEAVEFRCMAWQAPVGGTRCEECNKDATKPCSEYRCKALGQGCGIINAGTGNEECIWMNPRDTTSPGINAWQEILTNGYEYSEVKPRPAGQGGPAGMKIVKAGGGCINAFTPLEFGVETTEPAQCKVDYKTTKGFEEMGHFIGENNLFVTNHSQKISLPGTELINTIAPDAQSDGNYALYVRCRDGNGNENRDEFVIQFCVDKGPDVTPPIIKGTGPFLNNMPIQFGTEEVDLNVYTNEPAHCAWGRADADYDVLTVENPMTCSSQIWEMNAELLYTCTTTLTGLKDRQENKFFFRCKDNPGMDENKRNENRQGYEFTLIGTQPLDILSVGPSETIGGSTSVVTVGLEVATDNGYKNGESTCYFSETGEEGTYVEMFDTGGNIHNQDIDRTDGDYTIYFKCVDAGGNTAYDDTSFEVIVDTSATRVVRAYEENQKIKVVTNEKAECRYSTESCNYDFAEGILMVIVDDINHYAPWTTGQSYYIKCSDEYGNMPDPSSCTIIVRPSTIQ